MTPVFTLTAAGQDLVQEIDGFFRELRITGRTNAALKTMHEYSQLPACLPLFAIGMADHKDIERLEQLGYATWLQIDQTGD